MDAAAAQELGDLVLRHRVCWEVYPLRVPVDGGGLRSVGWQVDLLGSHGCERPPGVPGCETCHQIYGDLRRVAAAVMPPDDDVTECEVSGFEAALHYSHKRNDRPDVKLTITIHHETDYGAPVDAGEEQVLAAITRALSALGAHEGSWPREPPPAIAETVE